MISIFLIALSNLFVPVQNYPIPDIDNLLFYIQRNHNANTIVYVANFDEEGNLNPKKPIDVFWIRYAENGKRMKLRFIEKWFVYGVTCEKTNNHYDYRMKLAAKGSIKFWLKQTAPFEAKIITSINNVPSKLDHIFVTIDENSLIWKVLYGELFGFSEATGEQTYYKIIP